MELYQFTAAGDFVPVSAFSTVKTIEPFPGRTSKFKAPVDCSESNDYRRKGRL